LFNRPGPGPAAGGGVSGRTGGPGATGEAAEAAAEGTSAGKPVVTMGEVGGKIQTAAGAMGSGVPSPSLRRTSS